MRFRATQLGRRLQRGHTLQRRCYVAAHSTQGTSRTSPDVRGATRRVADPLVGRFLWSWVPMQRRAFAWGRRSSETTETSGLPGGEGCAACDDAKRPRPRKEIRLLPYPTTTQPHSQVPYRTGQSGHAFPRNPARQTLATWAYVAATMLCCSTFHARDVEDAAPYKAFARHSRLILTARQRYAKRFCTCQRSMLLWQRGGAM